MRFGLLALLAELVELKAGLDFLVLFRVVVDLLAGRAGELDQEILGHTGEAWHGLDLGGLGQWAHV
jgi:hypothetical protein